MFGDAARQLLKMIGNSGTVPGAILVEDVSAVLDRLKRAIKSENLVKAPDALGETAPHDDSDDQTVSLAYRALPLIELLAAAAQKNCNVMWEGK